MPQSKDPRHVVRKGRWIVAALTVAVAEWLLWPSASQIARAPSVTKSVNDHAYFFRLTAKYKHGDEPVEFDIVVGCGVRVTLSDAVGSSYDAFRDPLFYVKATQDGGAVLQIVPNACQGQTTDNGRVPQDFLPGAIWFDKKDDFTFGIAYIAEDAFENPKAKLKFLGAAIHPATKQEWEAFRPINGRNLLSSKWFSHFPPQPSMEEFKAHLWDREWIFNSWPIFDCYGVMRYRLTESAARELLQKDWPESRPRFWMPPGKQRAELEDRLKLMNEGRGPLLDGHYYREYFSIYETSGFGTRSGGGAFWSGGIASKVFPRRADDGVHWLKRELADAPIIYRDVDLINGTNAGYAYCYFQLRVGLEQIPE